MIQLKGYSVVILLMFSVGYLHGQDNFLEQEFNIWEPEEQSLSYRGRLALQSICDDFDLILDDEKIDCFKIILRQRPVSLNTHVINKREEDQLEGSGDENPIGLNKSAEEPAGAGSSILEVTSATDAAPDDPKVPDLPSNDDEVKPVITNFEEPNPETEEQNASTENANNEPVVDPGTETDVALPKEPTNFEKGDEPLPSENKENETQQKQNDTISDTLNEPAIVPEIKESPEKIPPKALPSDLAEVESPQKEKEAIYDLQSNNADIINHPPEGTNGVEGSGSDKVIHKMAHNANEQVEKDSPNTRENSQKVEKASKSVSVLIVLLVVGLIVGAAIFIRKYTRRNQDNYQVTPTTEKNGDVEQGTELKPLMKEGNKVIKESTDSTK
ncbi:uncharacterized protein LOC143202190 isoform X1 [Rhynchophorus ferrugineus]|uniref:uncharacterized protein LOC143202190 isoform X1 n=1 Tax=Rhynchophorus ferrugineus TaxID=354439 RepID=UPI003FCD53EB